MAKIKGVVFDVDGTLVDSVDLHATAWQETFRRWGHDIPFDQLRSQIGKGGDQLMPVFLSDAELERDGEALDADRGERFKQGLLGQVRPFPGVAGLFHALLECGLRLALGSSGKPEELDHYKRLLGIDDLDLAQTTSADAAKSKPHPDIFQAALDRLQLPPHEVIVVGDTPHDATAAKQAGVACIGLLCGGFAEADLRDAGCIAIYADPADLHARLDQSPIIGGTS